jgi:hypothetical protein
MGAVTTVERMAIPQSSSWEPLFESFGTQEVDLATIAAVFPSPTSILVNVLAMFASFYHSVFVGLSMFIMPLLVETVETPSFAHVLLLGSIDISDQEAATLRIMKHPWSSSTSHRGSTGSNGKNSPENHDVMVLSHVNPGVSAKHGEFSECSGMFFQFLANSWPIPKSSDAGQNSPNPHRLTNYSQ